VAGTRTIKIRAEGDSSGLDKMAGDGERSLSRWGSAFGTFAKGVAIAVAAAAVALVAFGKSSVDAFVEAQQSQARLQDAYARFPKLANASIESLRQLNTELAKKTRFDDDALASGQAILAQFNLTGQQIKALTPLLADYAAKTGKDVPDAAESLGKAFLGNTKALKELGINYKSTGNQALDVANITQLLRKQVGGFAEVEGKTAAGQAAILENQFGEIQETIGAALMPVLVRLGRWVLDNLIPAVQKLADWLADNLGPAIEAVWGWVRDNVFPIVSRLVDLIQIWLVPALADLGRWIKDNWDWIKLLVDIIGLALVVAISILATTIRGLVVLLDGLSAAFHFLADGIGKAVDWVKLKWDLFVVALGMVGQRFVDFGHRAADVWESVRRSVGGAVDWVRGAWDGIVGFFAAMPGRIGAALSGLGGVIAGAFKGAVNAAIDAVNWALDHSFNFLIRQANAVLSAVGGPRVPEIPHIPRLASGGVMARAGLALVGERGRELVSLPGGARVHSNSDTESMLGGTTEVRVFIGDEELRGIVRTEIVERDRGVRRQVLAGVGGMR
jgi:phage-related protein